MGRIKNGQNQSRKNPRPTDSQVDSHKVEHNQELTEPIMDTFLCGQNVKWLDSKVHALQVDRHPVRLTPKETGLIVGRINN